MKTKTIHWLIPICIAALIAGCSKADHKPPAGVAGVTPEGKMEMQFRWIVGKKYQMHMDLVSSSELTLAGQPKPMKQDTTMVQEYTISVLKELPNNGKELELEFTSARLESKLGERVLMSFDSSQDTARDAGNPVAPMLRKTIGGKVKYVASADGQIESVEGTAEFVSRISQGVQPMIQASFSSIYNEGYFKQLCNMARMAPGRGVKPGDSWRISLTEPMGSVGTLVANTQLKFENWETHGGKQCARIDSTSEITSKLPENTGKPPAMTTQINKGEATGTGWFDPELGMVIDSTTDQTLQMVVSSQGKSVPTLARQKVNMKLLGVADMAK